MSENESKNSEQNDDDRLVRIKNTLREQTQVLREKIFELNPSSELISLFDMQVVVLFILLNAVRDEDIETIIPNIDEYKKQLDDIEEYARESYMLKTNKISIH